jgi:hypothetical protein
MAADIEYWVALTRRPKAKKQFRWVIYCTSQWRHVAQASFSYTSPILARMDGERALTRLLDGLND